MMPLAKTPAGFWISVIIVLVASVLWARSRFYPVSKRAHPKRG